MNDLRYAPWWRHFLHSVLCWSPAVGVMRDYSGKQWPVIRIYCRRCYFTYAKRAP